MEMFHHSILKRKTFNYNEIATGKQKYDDVVDDDVHSWVTHKTKKKDKKRKQQPM